LVMWDFLCYLFIYLLLGLGFELRASHLQSRQSASWATPPVHFPLVILEMQVLWTFCPWLVLNGDPPNLSFPRN
jgi:hypothetical protein